MAAKDEQTSVRLSGELSTWARSLGERSMIAGDSAGTGLRVAAETLCSLAVAELTGLAWALPEATLMAEAVAGHLMSPGVGRGLLAADLQDMIHGLEASYAANHDTTTAVLTALVKRLSELTPGQDWALRDALSRWWAGSRETTVEGFRSVGIRVRT